MSGGELGDALSCWVCVEWLSVCVYECGYNRVHVKYVESVGVCMCSMWLCQEV